MTSRPTEKDWTQAMVYTNMTARERWQADNLKPGELYAGILVDPDYHVILLPGEAEDVTWKDAIAWAKKAGGELPTRREQSLLFANLKEQFHPRWYWSGEQHALYSDYAWTQNFYYGNQDYNNFDSYQGRARAVRRIPVKEDK